MPFQVFHTINSLVVTWYQRQILYSKIWLFLISFPHASKTFWKYKDQKSVHIFVVVIVVVELLAILWFFANYKLQNMSGPILLSGIRNWRLIYLNHPTPISKLSLHFSQAWSKPEIFQKSVSSWTLLFLLITRYFPFVDH